jgi:hypothetical protein
VVAAAVLPALEAFPPLSPVLVVFPPAVLPFLTLFLPGYLGDGIKEELGQGVRIGRGIIIVIIRRRGVVIRIVIRRRIVRWRLSEGRTITAAVVSLAAPSRQDQGQPQD